MKDVTRFLFAFRKHTLNCHRMKPALFQVLCEIKEKTGKFYPHTRQQTNNLHFKAILW